MQINTDIQTEQPKPIESFWAGESCEYCGGPIVEKQVTLFRQYQGQPILLEHVPAGVCTECGARFFAANVLKTIEEHLRGRHPAEKEILVPVFSLEPAPLSFSEP